MYKNARIEMSALRNPNPMPSFPLGQAILHTYISAASKNVVNLYWSARRDRHQMARRSAGSILGTKGSGSFEVYSDRDRTTGVQAWSVEAIDVGSISGLTISPLGGKLTMGSIVVWNGQFTRVGLSKILGEGEVVTRSTCEQKVTCGECTLTEGCAFCAATAKCMPSADLYAQGPAVGWCPSASWTTKYEQCGDSCHTVHTCSTCLSTIGCGWCAETCTCISRYSAGDYFDVTSKNTTSVSGCSSGWLGMLPVGQKCGAAKGDHCSANPVTAKASAQVAYHENQVIIKVSANESTPCRLCSSLDCGVHGRCKAIGPNIHCVCTDGYSGDHCQCMAQTRSPLDSVLVCLATLEASARSNTMDATEPYYVSFLACSILQQVSA
eukprot:scaffold157061_cov18-Tisochrysis_lutea.AAC.1